MSEPRASPIISPKWTARRLATGSAPGRPRQVGQVWVLGGSPNVTRQPQNILVRVFSWTWISRPITGSWSDTRGAPIECDYPFERERRVEQPGLAERRP